MFSMLATVYLIMVDEEQKLRDASFVHVVILRRPESAQCLQTHNLGPLLIAGSVDGHRWRTQSSQYILGDLQKEILRSNKNTASIRDFISIQRLQARLRGSQTYRAYQ